MRLGQLPVCTRAAGSSALLRIVLIPICPLLPLGTVPVETLVLCVARGPLSSPPPTCCSLLPLTFTHPGFVFWLSGPFSAFGVLCPLLLTHVFLRKPGHRNVLGAWNLLHLGLERSVGSFMPGEVGSLSKGPGLGSSHLILSRLRPAC